MKPYLIVVVCFLTVFQAAAQDAFTAQLQEIFDAGEEFARKEGERAFSAVLPADQQRRAKFWQSQLEELKTIPKDQLSKTDRINYEVYRFILEDRIADVQFEAYLIPFNAEGGFYNEMSYGRGIYRTEKAYEGYANRLKAFPQYMRDNMQLLSIGIEKGITAPRLIAENYRVLIAPFVEENIEKHLLYGPYLQIPEGWPAETRTRLQAEGRRLIRDSILTVYRAFDQFMQEKYLPAARSSIGISEIPNGKTYYEQRIAYFTTLPMTPDEVFETGRGEVARIRAEMEAIIAAVGFKGSFAEFLDFLRTDPQFYVTEPKTLLKEASYIAKKIDGKLPDYFGRLPRLPYGVQPVPAAIAPNYTGGRYSPGSVRGRRAGNYWVNTYKLESRPLYVLPSLTLHEAVPGHHLQMALAQEIEDQPRFRGQTYLSAFGEGWALYTEWLGKEMGIYETLYEDFGRLTYEMWRACRLVVDVGMHYKGWSREQALEFLSSNTALSLHECNTEINRYIGWPGQAVSYKIGELKIRELRQWAERELGENFDIRAFHDVVLQNGAVPLFVLEAVVKEYVGAAKHAPAEREEWTQLFNGKDLSGWDVKIRGYELNDNFANTFRVKDGKLAVGYEGYEDFNNTFGHIFYNKPYGYYRLRVEYRFVGEQAPNGPGWAYRNSGIMIHGQSAASMAKDQDFPISIEVQLLGGSGTGERSTANLCTPGTHVEMNGELWTQHCLNSSSKTCHGDQWVTVELLVLGDSLIQHFVEREQVLEYSKPQIGGGVVSDFNPQFKPDGTLLTGGSISLQSESHPVEFRTVELLNLEGCMDPKATNYKAYYVKSDNSKCAYD